MPTSLSLICPVCKSLYNSFIYQNHIQLVKCNNCRSIYNIKYKEIKYDDDYFISIYKRQYGKTYLEDFENIYANAVLRIKRIFKLLKKKRGRDKIRLVDIGSALGFFLKAAYDSGIRDILGIEVSGFAAGYARDRLSLNIINSSFDEHEFGGNYDVVTAWFFIEHCSDTYSILKKVYNILSKDGILAFSVPSFFGPMFIFQKDEWCSTHPIDHKVNLSPRIIRKILKKIGFSNIKIYPGSIHPERISPIVMEGAMCTVGVLQEFYIQQGLHKSFC